MVHTALARGITRLSVEDKVLIEREKPLVYFGDVCVEFFLLLGFSKRL